MSYVSPNFKTKKQLKEAVANGRSVMVYSPSPFGCIRDGEAAVEGPHYPEPHRWYARVRVVDGVVIKVIG